MPSSRSPYKITFLSVLVIITAFTTFLLAFSGARINGIMEFDLLGAFVLGLLAGVIAACAAVCVLFFYEESGGL